MKHKEHREQYKAAWMGPAGSPSRCQSVFRPESVRGSTQIRGGTQMDGWKAGWHPSAGVFWGIPFFAFLAFLAADSISDRGEPVAEPPPSISVLYAPG